MASGRTVAIFFVKLHKLILVGQVDLLQAVLEEQLFANPDDAMLVVVADVGLVKLVAVLAHV